MAVQSTAEIMDRMGMLPKAPASLGGKTLSELLHDGTVVSAIDPKFPQAIGISNVAQRAWLFANSHWEILLNEVESPFFTSDYPIALEAIRGRRVPNWILPLAPDLAIRIVPNVSLSGKESDGSISRFSADLRRPGHQEVRHCNQLIVRCAEELVFYRDDLPWIERFVAKNCDYRIDAVTDGIPADGGVMNISRQRIVRVKRP